MNTPGGRRVRPVAAEKVISDEFLRIHSPGVWDLATIHRKFMMRTVAGKRYSSSGRIETGAVLSRHFHESGRLGPLRVASVSPCASRPGLLTEMNEDASKINSRRHDYV